MYRRFTLSWAVRCRLVTFIGDTVQLGAPAVVCCIFNVAVNTTISISTVPGVAGVCALSCCYQLSQVLRLDKSLGFLIFLLLILEACYPSVFVVCLVSSIRGYGCYSFNIRPCFRPILLLLLQLSVSPVGYRPASVFAFILCFVLIISSLSFGATCFWSASP